MSRRVSTVLFLAAALEAAGCGSGLAAAIQDPNMVVLPDPNLAKAVHFDPRAATAGVAVTSPPLDDANLQLSGCSALDPCALPTPARSDVVVKVPKPTERLSERRRGHQPG